MVLLNFRQSKMRRSFIIASCILTNGVSFADGVSTGSGFFLTHLGHVVTNHHVVAGADALFVKDSLGNTYPATLMRVDTANDLAILKVNGRFSAIPVARSSGIRRGDPVFTMGFPNTGLQGMSIKLTDGTISSLSGIQDEPNSFQISVPIQPGNSGGPLVSRDGRVVGIVVAKLSANAAVKSGSTIPEVVNYAVKSNYLLELIDTDPNIAALIPSIPKDLRQRSLADAAAAVEPSVVLVSAMTREKKGTSAISTPPRPSQPDSPQIADEVSGTSISFNGIEFKQLDGKGVVVSNSYAQKPWVTTLRMGDLIKTCGPSKKRIFDVVDLHAECLKYLSTSTQFGIVRDGADSYGTIFKRAAQ
jgi:hypothetical protein